MISAWSYAGETSTTSAPMRFRSAEPAQDLEQFSAGHAAGLGGAGARRMRGVEHVDVDGHVHRPVAEALAQLVDDLHDALVVDVGRRDDAETEPPVVLEILLAVQRSAGADVAERLGVEDAFLDGPAERRAVGVFGAEVGVPGVQVRVEVHQCDGAVSLRRGAEQRKGDGVVTADRHQSGSVGRQRDRGGLDGLDGLVNVERVHRDIACVGDLGDLER